MIRIQRIASVGIALALAANTFPALAAYQDPTAMPEEEEAVDLYNNWYASRMTSGRIYNLWNNNISPTFVRNFPWMWSYVPGYYYGPYRQRDNLENTALRTFNAPLTIYKQSFYDIDTNEEFVRGNNFPPAIVQTGGDTEEVVEMDTEMTEEEMGAMEMEEVAPTVEPFVFDPTTRHSINFLELFDRVNRDSTVYTADYMSAAKMDFRRFVSDPCFVVLPGEIEGCMEQFGDLYDLRQVLMDGYVDDILVTAGYVDADDLAVLAMIETVHQEILARFR